MLNQLFITLSLIQQSSEISLAPCELDAEGYVIGEALESEAAEIPTDGLLRISFPLQTFAEDGSKLDFVPLATRLEQLSLGQIVDLESFQAEVDLGANLQIRSMEAYQDSPFNACENNGTCWIIQETETQSGSAFFCRAVNMPAAGIGALLIRNEVEQRGNRECEPGDDDCQSIRVGNAANAGAVDHANSLVASADGLGCRMNASKVANPMFFALLVALMVALALSRRSYLSSTAGKI